jgi:hypothetical protein
MLTERLELIAATPDLCDAKPGPLEWRAGFPCVRS